IPAETAFATKPKLARIMIARTLKARVPASWVAGDEVYGADPGLRGDLERRQLGYVLAVAKTHQVITGARARQAGALAARLPRPAGPVYPPGPAANGPGSSAGAGRATAPAQPGHHGLLTRRNRTPRELAFYRCYSPRHVPLPVLVKVAGQRWRTEENFQAAK